MIKGGGGGGGRKSTGGGRREGKKWDSLGSTVRKETSQHYKYFAVGNTQKGGTGMQ